MGEDIVARVGRLSERERECLRRVGELQRTKQIAQDLRLAGSTVDGYIASAVRKLDATDRMAAARLVADADRATYALPPSISPQTGSSFPRVATAWWRRFLNHVTRLPWPVPTIERPSNDLSPLQLAFATAVAIAALLVCAAAYLIAVAALAKLR